MSHRTPRNLLRQGATSLMVLTLINLTAAVRADEKPQQEGNPRTRIVLSERLEHCSQFHKGSFLGVELTNLSPELRAHFGAPDDQGAMVSRVVEGSAAAAAGLEVGDIITSLAGETVSSASELGRAVRGQKSGVPVEIQYVREGRLSTTSATLEEKERCAVDIGQYLEGIDWDEIGRASQEAIEGVDWQAITSHSLQISNEALEGALEGLREVFESEDWQKQLEKLKSLEVDGMEERMQQLQERMKELEKRIEHEVEESKGDEDQARLETQRVLEEIARVDSEPRALITDQAAVVSEVGAAAEAH